MDDLTRDLIRTQTADLHMPVKDIYIRLQRSLK